MKIEFHWSCEDGVMQGDILRSAGEQVGVLIPDSRRWIWCFGDNGVMLSVTPVEEALLAPALRAYDLVAQVRCFHMENKNL